MPARRPITDADRAYIRQLHGEGLGRNEIATKTGLSAGTITKVCATLGLSFDRSMTRVAVEARKIDLDAIRAELELESLLHAVRLSKRLNAAQFRYRVTYKETSEIVADDEPPIEAERALAQAINVHQRTAASIRAMHGDPGVSKTASTILKLADAFGINDAT